MVGSRWKTPASHSRRRKSKESTSTEDTGCRVFKKLEFLFQNLEEGDKKGQKGDMKESRFGKTRNVTGSSHSSKRLFRSSNRDSNDVPDHEERKIKVHENIYAENSSDEVEEVSAENGFARSAEKFISRTHDSVGKTENFNGKGISADANNHITSPVKKVVSIVPGSQKRKRSSSLNSEMLNWLLHVAKHSDDPAVASVPDCSKWQDKGDEEFWYQVLLVRKVLLTKRCVNSNVEETSKQKRLRMHPSMYEDVLYHQSLDKSRSSQRLPVIKSPTCSCCNSVPVKISSPQKVGVGNCPEEPPLLKVELPDEDKTDSLSTEECEKQVSVGSLFQAEVPEWTGEVFESDSKWLGERMWPPQDAGDKKVSDLDPIGRRETDKCDCLLPNSTECVRFHIAEKRLKLKRELGSLFYKWKFNHMGEEVSLSWTRDEENKFKEMLSLYSASTNKFWNNASKLFPSKSREMLVRYYFNVFLIQRRSYQNRVTPKDIDSDDDEKELGSVGQRFGYKAIYSTKSSLPICFENKQCIDLE